MPVTIIFDDADLIVIEKPARMHSVALGARDGNSVAEYLLKLFPHQSSVADKESDAGLIQRLDFDTSGLIVAARNRSTWERLRAMLLGSEISKRYIAVVDGVTTSSNFFAHTLLGSRHRGSRKVSLASIDRAPIPRMLESQTTFARLSSNDRFHISCFEAHAPVARRHQVRAHAAYVGHPLTGDTLYGSKQPLAAFGISGRSFFLLAHEVSFRHPSSGKQLTFQCSIPDELLALFPNDCLKGSAR
jgi:23S rRNA pseudouridine1911/1915/1917 synthase